MKTILRLSIPLILTFSLAAAAEPTAPEPERPAFFAFQNGVERPPAETAALLAELGYDGISASGHDVAPLLKELRAKGLKLFNTYLTMDLDASRPALDEPLRRLIDDLKGSGAALWIAIVKVTRDGKEFPRSSPEGDEVALARLREIADRAEPRGVKIALYPHAGFWLERFDDGARLAGKADRPGIGATFNLCHWLKVEGDRDPLPALEAALQRLLFVSVNGADGGDTKSFGWDRLIRTLDRGSYDVAGLVRRLRGIGYGGPVGLQCYGIGGDPRDNLARSMAAWRGMAAKRPNVLVILTDDQRWDALGVVGREQGDRALFPWFRTPNLDRLAAEGARFSNVFVTTSLCSPSRASLLSGRYARAHKVLNNFTEYPDDLPGYPGRLRGAGYETAYIGKWHMGEDNDERRSGFDFWMSHKGQGNYFDNTFNVNGARKQFPGYYTTTITDAAVEWIGRRHDRPWLLVVGQKAPHGGPIQPEPRFEHALDGFPVKKPANFEDYRAAGGKPAWLEESFPTWHGAGGPLYGQKDYDRFVRAYLATLLSVDESVGRIYGALKETGQIDGTVVVFTSDNGFVLGEHGRVDKRTAYEESLRVPLLVRYPPLAKAGTVVDDIVLGLDLAPSLVDICAARPLREIGGRSWTPLLAGNRSGRRDAFLYEYNFEEQFPYTPNVRAVRTAEWKFIRYPHGDGGPDRFAAELYDLRRDPFEMKNLAAEPQHAAVREKLERLLEALSKEIGPDSMPVYKGIRNVLPEY
jgi:arylsulfatase A-like enzyme/sugar phosphate isomerase/epimerase